MLLTARRLRAGQRVRCISGVGPSGFADDVEGYVTRVFRTEGRNGDYLVDVRWTHPRHGPSGRGSRRLASDLEVIPVAK